MQIINRSCPTNDWSSVVKKAGNCLDNLRTTDFWCEDTKIGFVHFFITETCCERKVEISSYQGGRAATQSPGTRRCRRCFRHRLATSFQTASGRWWRCRTRWRSSRRRWPALLRSPASWLHTWWIRFLPQPSTWWRLFQNAVMVKKQRPSEEIQPMKNVWSLQNVKETGTKWPQGLVFSPVRYWRGWRLWSLSFSYVLTMWRRWLQQDFTLYQGHKLLRATPWFSPIITTNTSSSEQDDDESSATPHVTHWNSSTSLQ